MHIDVTEDHSLLDNTLKQIKPTEAKVGTMIYGELGEGTPDTQTTPEQENQESDSSDTVEGEYREV